MWLFILLILPMVSISRTFTCEYAGLWCSCYTNDRNGCTVSCSPTIYKKIYNQTSCPPLDNFVLAGFSVL